MKMPELPKRKPSASDGGGIKPPAFISDLFKDMRDRRLIIPAIALLIAIVAVPVLLASEPEPIVPPVPVPADPDAAAFEPGVLAVEEAGIRDFQARLGALDRTNPFRGRFDPEEVKTTNSDDAGSGSLVEPGDAPGDAADTTPGASDTSSAAPELPPPPIPPEAPEPYVLVPRVNVEAGIAGRQQKKIENVEAGDVLPGKKAPTALYLGNTFDGEFAEFLVSRDVTEVNGDGTCRPRKTRCEFLRLADGEQANLDFALDGKRYSLRVTNIYFEKIDEDEFKSEDG